MSTIFIGIAGGTGSGKTTLTRHLKEHFGDAVTVIGHDSYYKRQDGKTYEERSKVNYDHPDAFETSLLVEHLKALKAGRSIQCPVYSYVDHNRTDETVEVFPTKVIIVEGILIFQDPTLRDMFDIKIFVETDADVRILRRALRDIRDRGRTLESVITQYLTTVKPMHEQYVEPSRKYADIIVLRGRAQPRRARHDHAAHRQPHRERGLSKAHSKKSSRPAAFSFCIYAPAKRNTTPTRAESPMNTMGCQFFVCLTQRVSTSSTAARTVPCQKSTPPVSQKVSRTTTSPAAVMSAVDAGRRP